MAVVYANTNRRIAHMSGLRPVMDQVAGAILAKAKAKAAKHTDTGHYISSLTVKKAGIDRLVVADDPASTIIEVGYLTSKGTWVPGQHILGGAVYG